MRATFKVDDIYSLRYRDIDGIFLFKVSGRTANSLQLQRPDLSEKTLDIFTAPNGAEAVRPLLIAR